jgi:succinate dehydrogenase / fumarate reductase cytochrome b subunit
MAFLIWALDASLRSPESFASLQDTLGSPLARLVLWAILAALIYHSLAGVRHLIMDMGVGESMEGGARGARIVIALAVVLTLLAGVWIW